MKKAIILIAVSLTISLTNIRCSDLDTSGSQLAAISGIYTAADYTPGDTLSITLWFGFDEVNSTSTNGGMRLVVIDKANLNRPTRYHNKHEVT